jgi:uncharacterized protein
MANPFVNVELNTTDTGAAKTFYGKLFGWKLQDMPLPVGTDTMIDVGEGTGGGIMQQLMPGALSGWRARIFPRFAPAAPAGDQGSRVSV